MVGPKSITDVGCGVGARLKVFRESKVEVVLRFDLATSLEVTGRLPESSADTIVNLITSLAPVVFFSAAISGQGGNDPVNGQWQADGE